MEVLSVKNMTKSFGAVEAVNDVSFTLNKGEVLAIIGPSGSGKSTLLRCLCFLEKMQRGSISINGESIVSVNKESFSVYPPEKELRLRALKLGLVFQNFNLFPHLSVKDNLTLAPLCLNKVTQASAEIFAAELLSKVGLSAKINSYPFELSGGQQQRVAIARALAMQPEILCFDEPTSALDPELTGEVLKVIKDIKETLHSTMIIVTHEMNFAKNIADRIIFMDEGRALECGTPEEIFENCQNPRINAFLSKFSAEDK